MKLMFTLLVLLAAACPGRAQQNEDSATKSKIIALEHLLKMQAYESKDLKTLGTIMGEEFVDVSPEGDLLNKAQLLEYVQRADSMQCVTKAMVVNLHRDTAIVTGL